MGSSLIKLDVNDAVKAAKAAFDSWSFSTAESRAGYLNAIADELERRKPFLTTLEVPIKPQSPKYHRPWIMASL